MISPSILGRLLFNSKNPLDNINNLKRRITTIKNETNRKINIKELKNAVKYGLQTNFGLKCFDDKLNRDETALAKRLRKEKHINL